MTTSSSLTPKVWVMPLLALLIALVSTSWITAQTTDVNVTGRITDINGSAVSNASVSLVHAQQAVLQSVESDSEGNFSFASVPPGSYELRVVHRGFAVRRMPITVASTQLTGLAVNLDLNPLHESVSVTAEAGQAADRDKLAQAVNIIPEAAIQQRTTAVLAQVADEEVGVALQRTSPTIGAIFIRGLTGKNTSTYIDGVRYTTSAGRGGINTFLNLTEPSGLRAVEILRGPNGAQYGSDSLGGTVSLVSRSPMLGSATPEFHGEANTFFTSADLSFGGNTLVTYGTERFGALLNLAGRRVNTLRAANGLDGHSAVTRFLGLPSSILGDRLTDTAFTQYGGNLKLSYAPDGRQQFIGYYQRGQQDGGKRYDQTIGGDGNLISDLRNLMNDFTYGRYLRQGFGFFDNASFSVSYNTQREERVNQGGRGNPLAAIIHQKERTHALGFSFFVDKQIATNNTLLIGGDIYRETVNAPAHTFDPVKNTFTNSRPRVPNGARYLLGGVYVQDVWEAVPDVLRLSGALRYNVASYRSRAVDSPVVAGKPLFPDDSLRVGDVSGRIGGVVTVTEGLNLSFNYSRGFRAPNMTDLGTLGLTGDGYETDYLSALALGGTIGTTANDRAVSTGIPVSRQGSEISNNFDAGIRVHRGRIDTDLTGFVIDINEAIVKQALILPAGAVGKTLGDQTITGQAANGAVFVPLSATPVLVRANFTDARIYGLEYTLNARLTTEWTFGGNFTYLRAYDKDTGLPPNIEGGTPPASGFIKLGYAPRGGRYWIEAYSTLAGRQNRLSTLDLSDRRTGAERSRNNIRDFFRAGACVRGLVAPGPDGRCNTGDETVLISTGETLNQVQNRVLGTANSAPLFPYLPGYGLFNLRGGVRLGERSSLGFDFENIGDKSYRGPSWGIDGPGRSVTVRYQYKF